VTIKIAQYGEGRDGEGSKQDEEMTTMTYRYKLIQLRHLIPVHYLIELIRSVNLCSGEVGRAEVVKQVSDRKWGGVRTD
jgi:hypothetical protein